MRTLTVCLLAGIMAAAVPAVAAAQASAARTPYKAPRTAHGHPDLQGFWTNATLTPLQRPAALGERRAMTPAEVAKTEGDQAGRVEAGNRPVDPKTRTEDLPVNCYPGFSGTNCGYDIGWIDPGSKVMRVDGEPRTSFITTPANGQVPPRKAGAPQPPRLLQAGMRPDDNPETKALGERCIVSFGRSSGPPMLPLLYNNNYQIVQTKDHVAIVVEMVHDVRNVRLNSQHLPSNVRPWMGDSIGRYEGDTLVVETTNFPPLHNFQGAWENLKVTERFTRTRPNAIKYEFRIEDPTVWDAPWGGEYEFSPSDGQIYEYACHEGNYGLQNILAGARQEDEQLARQTARPAGTQ